MSVSNTVTFKQTPPIRPGIADIRDGEKANETGTVPPDMPNASEHNQSALLLEAYGQVAPLFVMSIEFSAGAPLVHSLGCIRTDKVSGDFTLTDNGAGDTSITFAAGTFPSAKAKPVAGLNGSAAGFVVADPISNGVRVRTFNSAAAAADLPFTVEFF